MRLFGRQRKKPTHPPVEISESKGVRYLHLGGPAIQSAMRIRTPDALELEYTRAMMAFLLFVPAPRDILLVGLGGGSIAKFLVRRLADIRLRAVEINPEVIAAAHSYFELPDAHPALEVIEGDGAEWVMRSEGKIDVLLVDGYDANRIVEALSSEPFYANCLAALRPGGCAVFNLWGTDRFFDTYVARIETAFGHRVLCLPAEQRGNVQVFAFRMPMPEHAFAALADRAAELEAELGLGFLAFLRKMRDYSPGDGRGFVF